jgi:WD40 repeat protein
MAERLATMAPDVAATAPHIHFTHPVLPRESEYQASRVGNAVLWRSAAGEIRAALSARGSRHGVVCVVGFDRAGSPLLDTAHLCDRIHDMRIWAAQTTAAPQDEGGASAASSAAESAVAPRRDLRLVCGGHDKSVYVLSLDALDCGGAQQHVELLYAFDTKHSWAVHTLDVTSSSPSDGALCVTGSNSDKYVRVWRLGDKSATLLRKVGPLGREMRPRSFSVMQTRFSPNGDAIAVTNSNEFMDDTLQFILPQ